MIVGYDTHREKGGIERGTSIYSRLLHRYLIPELKERGLPVYLYSTCSLPREEGGIVRIVRPSRPWLLTFPFALSKDRCDAVLIPASPFPFRSRTKIVATLHDLGYETHPWCYPFSERLRLKALMGRTLARAHRIIAPSFATRDTLLRRLPWAKERVVVIHHGIEYDRFACAPHDRKNPPLALSSLAPETPLILAVGMVDVKKNSMGILRGFLRYRARHHDGSVLAYVGWEGYRGNEVRDAVKRERAEHMVRFVPAVSYEELPSFYARGSLLVSLSLIEGFGFPLLEAFASSIPVVASAIPAHREVGANAAHFVDPFDEEALARGIALALQNASWREVFIARGRSRAHTFSWQATARRTADLLEESARASSRTR